MPASQQDIDDLFALARVEWNKAEEVVKSAEQICGEAVVPSIKEFRYAGRRVIDALHEMGNGNDLDVTLGLLKDAIFNCHCARHDAIDVATAVIASNLSIVVDKIGYEHILKAFPRFADLRKSLNVVRSKIRQSRGNRTERDTIYAAIHDADLPALAALYDDFQAAEDIMKSLARRERRNDQFKNVTTVVSIMVAIAACTFTGYNATKKPASKTVEAVSATKIDVPTPITPIKLPVVSKEN